MSTTTDNDTEFKCVPIVGDLIERMIHQTNGSFDNGFSRVMPGDVCVPTGFADHLDTIVNCEDIRDDDVWIVTFPKSGTTWTQEMVWCILNDMNLDAAKRESLHSRSPFFELYAILDATGLPAVTPTVGKTDAFFANTFDVVANLASPRCVKTHLPFQLLPRKLRENKNAKIVYVARNVKDVAVSYYYHHKLLDRFTGSFDFADYFLNDMVRYSPFWDHILGYWKLRDRDNVLFLRYEDMIKDQTGAIERVCQFLGKSYSADQLKALSDHLSFDKMKQNASVNFSDIVNGLAEAKHIRPDENSAFIRKGIVGDWQNHMSKELEQRFDQWRDKMLAGSDYKE